MIMSIVITDTCGCGDHEATRGEMVGDAHTVGRIHAQKLPQGHHHHHGHHHGDQEDDQSYDDQTTGSGALSKRNPAKYKGESVASSLWSEISGWVILYDGYCHHNHYHDDDDHHHHNYQNDHHNSHHNHHHDDNQMENAENRQTFRRLWSSSRCEQRWLDDIEKDLHRYLLSVIVIIMMVMMMVTGQLNHNDGFHTS